MDKPRWAAQEDAILLQPVLVTGKGFYVTVGALGVLVLVGVASYVIQFNNGLGVTGLNYPVSWGFYIVNFVFFIGISHAGTLISAILRLSQAEWRRPITRVAEVITVMVLGIGGMNIIIDLGRPDRISSIFLYGRYQSPLLWDATSITAYLTASTVYLYIPMIPDIAILRDAVDGGWRKTFYSVFALGWTGSKRQHRVLNRAITILAVLVVPIAVSVHTVVSFVFSMTVQPMWHSTIFGPYFVVGAIFSGIAALLVIMAILRRIFHLEDYLQPIHFNYLGLLMLVMVLLWSYFTFAEYLTTYYGNEPAEMRVFMTKFDGQYSFGFWAMVFFNVVIPLPILAINRTRTITGTVVAAVSIMIGMWLERYIIIAPTLANPRLHQYATGSYVPSLVEIGIMVGCFSLFALFYVLFSKIFPIVSISEVREGRKETLAIVEERVRRYTPGLGRLTT
ncbi:MAG: polysulfide reductase NrfD [Candidatus Lambdaproteobacteria bacterium]|nr:polysulfide reductase NrfD [Candidatus Lambdaproteobacteria bacterium]